MKLSPPSLQVAVGGLVTLNLLLAVVCVASREHTVRNLAARATRAKLALMLAFRVLDRDEGDDGSASGRANGAADARGGKRAEADRRDDERIGFDSFRALLLELNRWRAGCDGKKRLDARTITLMWHACDQDGSGHVELAEFMGLAEARARSRPLARVDRACFGETERCEAGLSLSLSLSLSISLSPSLSLSRFT